MLLRKRKENNLYYMILAKYQNISAVMKMILREAQFRNLGWNVIICKLLKTAIITYYLIYFYNPCEA